MTTSGVLVCTRRLAWVLLVAAVAACSDGEARVGVLLPLSGPLAQQGEEARRGIELAWQELPEAERPLLVSADSLGTGVGTAAGFHDLVDQGATLVLGPITTECALTASAAAANRRVAFVTPSATGEEVTRDNPYAMRFCAGDVEMARELAVHARYTLRLSRLAVIVDLSSRHSLGFGEAFAREFQVRRGRIVEELTYQGTGRSAVSSTGQRDDRRGLLDRVAELDVEGVLVAGDHDDVLLMLEAARSPRVRELVLLGSSAWEGPALEASLPGRVGGAWRVSHYHHDEAALPSEAARGVSDFITRFEAAYGEPPGDLAALAYDTARAAFAVFDPSLDGPAIRERLAEIQFFVGITGSVHMDPGGRPRAKTFVLEQLHDEARSGFVQRLGD